MTPRQQYKTHFIDNSIGFALSSIVPITVIITDDNINHILRFVNIIIIVLLTVLIIVIKTFLDTYIDVEEHKMQKE